MKILVCGGRKYGEPPKKRDGSTDFDHPDFPARKAEHDNVMSTLERLARIHSKFYDPEDNWLPTDIEIISGMADGADSCAVDWAVVNWTTFHPYPAEWTDLSHPDAVIKTRWDGSKYDARAGHRRNQKMLDEGKPDLVVAFPGGTGTDDMVKRSLAAGVAVIKIGADGCQTTFGDQKK